MAVGSSGRGGGPRPPGRTVRRSLGGRAAAPRRPRRAPQRRRGGAPGGCSGAASCGGLPPARRGRAGRGHLPHRLGSRARCRCGSLSSTKGPPSELHLQRPRRRVHAQLLLRHRLPRGRDRRVPGCGGVSPRGPAATAAGLLCTGGILCAGAADALGCARLGQSQWRLSALNGGDEKHSSRGVALHCEAASGPQYPAHGRQRGGPGSC
jgi:hypothetical protein